MSRNDCILWTGGKSDGYGSVGIGGRSYHVHRLVYEEVYGPVPAGWEVHHICHNRACMNIVHLVALTRSAHKLKHRPTECPKGHPYDDENTYIDPGGGIRCRRCHRERMRGSRR